MMLINNIATKPMIVYGNIKSLILVKSLWNLLGERMKNLSIIMQKKVI